MHGTQAEPGRKMVWEAINMVLLRNLTSAAAKRQRNARVIVTNFEPCRFERINILQAGAENAEAKSNP
jgi:hypothetical protein